MGADRAGHVLAHATVSRMRAPLDDPAMARFVAIFADIAAAARRAPGFRWQRENRGEGHPPVHPDDPLLVVSISTWRDYESLHAFVYRSDHGRALLRRDEWFEPMVSPATVLWWVPATAEPDVEQAVARLSHLRRVGPTPRAFSLVRRFDAEGRLVGRPRRF